MRKIQKRYLVVLIFIILCLICLGISIFNILKWKNDSNKIDEQVELIEEVVEVKSVEYSDAVEIIEKDVDFDELKNVNNQTRGWIQVNGTNINYPFVQASDNKYYLNHSFNKSYNKAGWLFLDYRNDISSLSKNTIIYGHSRIDKTMFRSLKNILKSGWLNHSNNYVVKMSTEAENTLWQVFSVYHIPETSDYIKVDFSLMKNLIVLQVCL